MSGPASGLGNDAAAPMNSSNPAPRTQGHFAASSAKSHLIERNAVGKMITELLLPWDF